MTDHLPISERLEEIVGRFKDEGLTDDAASRALQTLREAIEIARGSGCTVSEVLAGLSDVLPKPTVQHLPAVLEDSGPHFDAIIHRVALDDFWALRIATALQSSHHCEVFSMTLTETCWNVWAKFDSREIATSDLDALIDAALGLTEEDDG